MVIGFSEDDYTADEGEPGYVWRPNTPCAVTVEIIERALEIPLQIKLTPGEGNATSKKVECCAYHMVYSSTPYVGMLLLSGTERYKYCVSVDP